MPRFFVEAAWDLTPEQLAVARARVRRHWLAAGAALVLAVAVLAGARPAVHAVKRWQSRHLAAQAMALIERRQWPQARDRAADACALQPGEPMALRAFGRLLARTHSAGAGSYYLRLQEMAALTPEDRRDFAGAALSEGEVSAAAGQSAWLLAHDRVANGTGVPPTDLLLAAQVASANGDERAALDFARQILAAPSASETERFTAALRLVNAAAPTDPDGPAAAPAWREIRRLADSRGPIGLDALTLCSRRLSAPAPGGAAPPGWMAPADIARALENHPLSRAPQKLLAADLAAGNDPAARAAALDAGVARWRDADDDSLAALADWLLRRGEPGRALDVLPAARAARVATLYLRRLEALATLGRWTEMKASLMENNPLDPVSQGMYLAVADVRLGNGREAADAWRLALEAAGRDPGKLFTVGQYAEKQDAPEVAETAYAAAVAAAPRMRPAHEALIRLDDARGQTAKACAASAAMLELWPQDEQAANLEAYLQLLLGTANAPAAAAIERNAAALAAREPGNWQARATLALARLRQGRAADALQSFAGLQAAGGGPVPPGALAVRAAALAATGWRDEARADARSLNAVALRPEERALIAPIGAE